MEQAAEALLRRHRAVSIAALVLLVGLAWAWLLAGAGMPTAAMAMAMPSEAPRFLLTWSMWVVMMVAMMVPSAAPVILLYGRAARKHNLAGGSARFLLGYLLAWTSYALVAALLQLSLEHSGAVSMATMAVGQPKLSGLVLIGAAIYQLSPWKGACLSRCRNPADFIARNHRLGPLRMGFSHGSWCVGCCWALMLLLFVGGVMNLAWIAALTLLVAAEKLVSFGRWIAPVSAIILLAWGTVLLVAG